jgi:hypothetical protein
VALARKWTIPTERRPLVGEVSANFCGYRVSRVVSTTDPHGHFLSFLDRCRYYFFQIASHLYSRGWADPVPDPLLLRKSGSAGNLTRDLWICSQELWPLDDRGGLDTDSLIKQPCTIWGSLSGGYEEFYLLEYKPVQSVESQPNFQSNMLVDFQQTTWRYIPEARTLFKIASKYCHVCGVPWLIMTGSGLDNWIYWNFFYNLSESQTIIALSLIYPLHKSLGHAKSSQSSLVVSWQRIYSSLTVTATHIKSSFRRLTPLHSVVLLQFSFSLFHNYYSVLLQLSYIHFARNSRIRPSFNNS